MITCVVSDFGANKPQTCTLKCEEKPGVKWLPSLPHGGNNFLTFNRRFCLRFTSSCDSASSQTEDASDIGLEVWSIRLTTLHSSAEVRSDMQMEEEAKVPPPTPASSSLDEASPPTQDTETMSKGKYDHRSLMTKYFSVDHFSWPPLILPELQSHLKNHRKKWTVEWSYLPQDPFDCLGFRTLAGSVSKKRSVHPPHLISWDQPRQLHLHSEAGKKSVEVN